MQDKIYLKFERFRETPELQHAAKAACSGRCVGRQGLDNTIAAIVENSENNYASRSPILRAVVAIWGAVGITT